MLIAIIAASGAWCAAGVAFLNWRSLRTPSKRSIGELAEHTYDITSVDVGTTQAVLAQVLGDPEKAAELVARLAAERSARVEVERLRG